MTSASKHAVQTLRDVALKDIAYAARDFPARSFIPFSESASESSALRYSRQSFGLALLFRREARFLAIFPRFHCRLDAIPEI
jgi:hypothetical protein